MSKTFLAVVVSIVTLVATSANALAGGEPKNQWPFTRPFGDGMSAQMGIRPASNVPPHGEPKSELPFMRPGGAEPSTVVLATRGGFHWIDASIGAATALGIALALLGGVALVRGTRDTTAATH